jgi:hypothetical protein
MGHLMHTLSSAMHKGFRILERDRGWPISSTAQCPNPIWTTSVTFSCMITSLNSPLNCSSSNASSYAAQAGPISVHGVPKYRSRANCWTAWVRIWWEKYLEIAGRSWVSPLQMIVPSGTIFSYGSCFLNCNQAKDDLALAHKFIQPLRSKLSSQEQAS